MRGCSEWPYDGLSARSFRDMDSKSRRVGRPLQSQVPHPPGDVLFIADDPERASCCARVVGCPGN